MQKWEYLMVWQSVKKITIWSAGISEDIKIKLGHAPEVISKELSKLGDEGWEVCGYTWPPKETFAYSVITLKRPIE